MLCAVAALLLLHTGTICSNGNVLEAYQLANQGWTRLRGSNLPPQPADGAAACSSWQPLVVLLAYALIGQHLHVSELAQRRAFLARARRSCSRRHLHEPPGGQGASARQQLQPEVQAGRQRQRQSQEAETTHATPNTEGAAAGEPAVLQLLLNQSYYHTAADYWLSFALPGICCLRALAQAAAIAALAADA
jgi:hypothetical protein